MTSVPARAILRRKISPCIVACSIIALIAPPATAAGKSTVTGSAHLAVPEIAHTTIQLDGKAASLAAGPVNE